VPDNKYSAKKSLPIYSLTSSLCRVSHSAKPSPSVFYALPSALGSVWLESIVVWSCSVPVYREFGLILDIIE
jgi:hypothetical protein